MAVPIYEGRVSSQLFESLWLVTFGSGGFRSLSKLLTVARQFNLQAFTKAICLFTATVGDIHVVLVLFGFLLLCLLTQLLFLCNFIFLSKF
jgi:hypothetical protein